MGILAGIGLMLLGAVLLLLGFRSGSSTATVNATNGSVSVGGDNQGSITNVSNTSPSSTSSSHSNNVLKVTGVAVELVGVAIALWNVVYNWPVLVK